MRTEQKNYYYAYDFFFFMYSRPKDLFSFYLKNPLEGKYSVLKWGVEEYVYCLYTVSYHSDK